MIERVDLGPCGGYEWGAGRDRTALALPGAKLGGMPSIYFAITTLYENGWRVVQVWDEWDGETDRLAWAEERAAAALAYAGNAELIAAKSLTTLLTHFAADHTLTGVWLTPLLHLEEVQHGLRRRTAPALLVGGTADETWDGAVAREVADQVVELPGADHGLARLEDLPPLVDAVRSFAA